MHHETTSNEVEPDDDLPSQEKHLIKRTKFDDCIAHSDDELLLLQQGMCLAVLTVVQFWLNKCNQYSVVFEFIDGLSCFCIIASEISVISNARVM